MIIQCPKCENVITTKNEITTHLDNPLMACPVCDKLFSLSQVKDNPIDQRIQAINNALLTDVNVMKVTNWCEEC